MRLLRVAVAAAMLSLLVAAPALAGLPTADVSVTKTDTPDPVAAGGTVTYTITVTNGGPDTADGTTFGDSIPAGMTFVSFTTPGGWVATTPAVGTGGTGGARTFRSVQWQFGVHPRPRSPRRERRAERCSPTTPAPPAPPWTLIPRTTAPITATTVSAPAASNLPNAAMPEPTTGSPLVVLGFGALLVSVLTTAAVLNRRRYRP